VTGANPSVCVRLFHGARAVDFESGATIRLEHEGGSLDLPSHSWSVSLTQAIPPRQHFHAFVKTFKTFEMDAMNAYIAGWKLQGYPVEPILMGSRYPLSLIHI